ncbi:Bardet-Biedl syndrome 2 protein homolog [Prorops nasuta]|uniref:Bardet-Biedl syndrome 2 protein homolog n=1 Tax=Prorops nasuta TaxID=863751 RepID=UPI0034CE5D61
MVLGGKHKKYLSLLSYPFNVRFFMAAFSLNIHKRIEPKLVTSGKFDGSHACLAAATVGGNVLLHSPHRQPVVKTTDDRSDGRLSWSGEIAELNIGSQVTSICTGHFGDDERDVLLVGTSTHVLAYHIEENSDLFYKEVSDGTRCMIIGRLGWLSNHVAIVGGNSSITILDSQGVEIFWTVMGDMVITLAILDFDGDGENELLTGTSDYEIKVHKKDVILWDTRETASVTALAGLPNRQFAYSVANGTIGMYEGGVRLWRVKSKHKVVAINDYDINGDGTSELITGWSNGKVDARTCSSGEVIFKVQLNAGIAGLVEADYRRTGRSDLVIVSTTGEVRGYSSGSLMETAEPGELVRELLAKKQALQMELRQRAASVPSMYHGTKLAVSLVAARGAARLGLAAGPGLVVHCAVVFAEGVFEGETLVSHPNHPRGELEIELRPSKNGTVDIHVKACVGPPDADLLQVFEMTRQLPRFCMYEVIGRPQAIISQELNESGVIIEVAERPQRIALWLNQSFIFVEEFELRDDSPDPSSIELWLRGLRDNKLHCFMANHSGKINVRTEDSSFAGDIVQSLSMYLGLRELAAEANFPLEESKMSDALERVKGLKEVDSRLQAEAAGGATLLKHIVIRLEDARILEDMADMRRRVCQLKNINGDLIREHEIGMKSYKELAKTLKELNIAVQRVARLRVGKAATNAVTRCRNAIQDENVKALVLAMRHG